MKTERQVELVVSSLHFFGEVDFEVLILLPMLPMLVDENGRKRAGHMRLPAM